MGTENKRAGIKGAFLNNIRKYTMLIALVGIWVIFTFLTEGIFISPRNLSNLFLQTVAVGIIAVGMTLVIVTRNIDLSVGSIAAFTGAVGAFLQVKLGWPAHSAILVALFSGLLIGVWHGFWIGYRLVPAFIVTLASMMIFRGAVMGITKGATIAPLSDMFKAIGQNYVAPNISMFIGITTVVAYIIFELTRRSKRVKYGFTVTPIFLELVKIILISAAVSAFFMILVHNRGIPYAVLLLMFLTLLFHFIAQNTVFGRQLYAIGGNPDAAALSGVNIKKRIMALYMVFGVLTAAAGIVLTARLNAATTSAGQGMELDVIAASVIGGTSLMGGEGTILGAVIGALIMASLDNGMSLMNTDITYQYVIKGLILLLAVWVDIATRKKS
ncbi:MAG: sugar ABC transporter permease [Candidatus Omnitrophica bacterium]|nr:sugar ABC transporter permease [Candidatus Omnitrophota bacterium]MDD5166118.1 sugar ABC transporter permease [Candidatus Omnitrophota bacterium]